VGEIIAWPLDTWDADTYLECKGQILAVATYGDLYAVIGNKYNTGTAADGTSTFALPDLRGYFLRGVGANGGEGAAGIKQDDTTRLPRTVPFTADSNGGHRHSAGIPSWSTDDFGHYGINDTGVSKKVSNAGSWSTQTPYTDYVAAHTHTISGGDLQTRPISFSVRWLIRIKAINGGARGPAGAAGARGIDGDGWTVGDIKQSILTETQFKAQFSAADAAKWVLADGRNVAGTTYATLTGSATVPDLRGSYLRMAGQNNNAQWNGGTLNAFQEDATRLPRSNFVVSTQNDHQHNIPYSGGSKIEAWTNAAKGLWPTDSNWGTDNPVTTPNVYTGPAGGHSHTLSGGDTETRPKSYTVNYFIKVN